MVVDPRISANSRVTGISAPVTPDLRKPLMQRLQIAGLPGNRPKPTCLRTEPPAPPNGAAQSLQRGEVGIRFIALRMATRSPFSPIRIGLEVRLGRCRHGRTVRRDRDAMTTAVGRP